MRLIQSPLESRMMDHPLTPRMIRDFMSEFRVRVFYMHDGTRRGGQLRDGKDFTVLVYTNYKDYCRAEAEVTFIHELIHQIYGGQNWSSLSAEKISTVSKDMGETWYSYEERPIERESYAFRHRYGKFLSKLFDPAWKARRNKYAYEFKKKRKRKS